MPRVIAILIDAGQSMNRDILPGQGSGTVLQNAITIVGEFLKALSSGDFVNIIMFDSTKVTPLSPSMVIALILIFKFSTLLVLLRVASLNDTDNQIATSC